MSQFEARTQPVRFLAADGETPIDIPIPAIDVFNVVSISTSINYGAQMGACIMMLLVVLIMTPSDKLRRPSTLLQISSLVVCTIRMALLNVFFLSPFNEFYNYWAGDYTEIASIHFHNSIAANVFSLLLVISTEASLVHQAWALVNLWPSLCKYTLSAVSVTLTLLTIGWRMVLVVILNQAVTSAESTRPLHWVFHGAMITNAASICWYCALFNIKLAIHVVTNRGILLRRYRSLTPMEVLVMANGLLMIVPVIFCGLEWGHWPTFEAASLTLTSVALTLPLASLSAQRLSQSYGLGYEGSSPGNTGFVFPAAATTSHLSPKAGSFAASSNATSTHFTTISRCEAGAPHRVVDPIDVELGRIQADCIHDGQIKVENKFEMREERR